MNKLWTSSQIARFGTLCETATRAGGAVLRDYRGRVAARNKGPFDVVTEADFAAQKAVRDLVLGEFPDHHFLGEEQDGLLRAENPGDETPCWIVDPLDGTTNYVHGIPHYCVSVALAVKGQILAGAVFDPERNECFTATQGGGAYLNTTAIHVSRVTDHTQALLAANLPSTIDPNSEELRRFVRIVTHIPAIRRMGSAALNLCYLAAGRFNGYWASSVHPWDVAAGILLLREAGGVVTSILGNEFELHRPALLAAGTPELHQQLLKILAEV